PWPKTGLPATPPPLNSDTTSSASCNRRPRKPGLRNSKSKKRTIALCSKQVHAHRPLRNYVRSKGVFYVGSGKNAARFGATTRCAFGQVTHGTHPLKVSTSHLASYCV